MCRFDFGLTEEETWNITRRKMRALMRAHLASERREQERVGFLAFTVARSSGSKPKGGREFRLEDFIPKRRTRESDKGSRPSVESMVRFAEIATQIWGGRDLRNRGKNNAG